MCLSLEISVLEVLWCAPGIEGNRLDADGGLWLSYEGEEDAVVQAVTCRVLSLEPVGSTECALWTMGMFTRGVPVCDNHRVLGVGRDLDLVQLSVLTLTGRLTFRKTVRVDTEISLESIMKVGVMLLFCMWFEHVWLVDMFAGDSAVGVALLFGIKRALLAQGLCVMCLRGKCRVTLWDALPTCSQASLLFQAVGH